MQANRQGAWGGSRLGWVAMGHGELGGVGSAGGWSISGSCLRVWWAQRMALCQQSLRRRCADRPQRSASSDGCGV